MHDGKRLRRGFRSPLMLAITAFITPYFYHLKPLWIAGAASPAQKYITA